jgi:hypothetical protein
MQPIRDAYLCVPAVGLCRPQIVTRNIESHMCVWDGRYTSRAAGETSKEGGRKVPIHGTVSFGIVLDFDLVQILVWNIDLHASRMYGVGNEDTEGFFFVLCLGENVRGVRGSASGCCERRIYHRGTARFIPLCSYKSHLYFYFVDRSQRRQHPAGPQG